MPNAAEARATVLSPEDIIDQPDTEFNDPACGDGISWKTLVSASQTNSHKLTSGIAKCAPSTGHLCVHQHQQAELYHIIQGNGIITIDSVESAVETGSVIFIPGDAKHGIRNTDEAQDLVWLYVFAADDFSEIQYRFPHKEERYIE